MMTVTSERIAATSELRWMLRQARIPRLRTMREFAQQELVIPDGPFAGRRFDVARQPFTGLWLDAVDSGQWRRFFSVGPTQSGKTLLCFIIPILYHLFEMKETVVCGVPSLDMVKDKWEEDLLPAIERSRYRTLLPRTGSSSRGGTPSRVKLRNGATLRFMTGGGGDKARAHFTTRVVVVTETDAFAEPGGRSMETSKLKQLEARTRAYRGDARFYAECTVTIEDAPTWLEYTTGTRSRIAIPCPHCKRYVTLDRDALIGWRSANSIIEARTKAAWQCPECSESWTDEQRANAARSSVLVHDGQDVGPKGELTGTPRETDTLGFRWSAIDNLFVDAADVAADEWRGMQAADELIAERELRQFVWALPHEPPKTDLSLLDVRAIEQRMVNHPRGELPPGTLRLVMGVDIGQYLIHWGAIAFREAASGHILDYGRIEVASSDFGVERAVLIALRELRDQICLAGWGEGKARRQPDAVWIDSGWMSEIVYAFCEEGGEMFSPAKGFGAGMLNTNYHSPESRNASISRVGEGYHFARLRSTRDRSSVKLAEVDANHWKTWLHKRLTTPLGLPGAMTLYHAEANTHLSLAKHLTSERQIEEFDPKRGTVIRWERVGRSNHWFDALYLACAAGHSVGVRLLTPTTSKPRTITLSEWAASAKNSGRWRVE